MRYFLWCSYVGTEYHGWQQQPNGISVQEVLTNALRTLLRDELTIVGAGRTDAGVHAAVMVAHFDSDVDILAIENYLRRINSILPADIAVHRIAPVLSNAHARFDAISRRYEYRVCLRKDVFRQKLSVRLHHEPDFVAMNVAAEKLKTYTDFTSFSKLHTDVMTNNCVMMRAEWTNKGDEWVFTIEADRFLRNMVRAVVGTLLEVGYGRMSIEHFCAVIEARNRCKAGVSVPAHGLYLVDVSYPDNIFL